MFTDLKHWSLTTLREKLVKIGAKMVRHARYVTFQLAEVAVRRSLLVAILDRIERLALPPPDIPDACVGVASWQKNAGLRSKVRAQRARSPAKELEGA